MGGGTNSDPIAMGMDPYVRTHEQVAKLLDRTDANLREMGR